VVYYGYRSYNPERGRWLSRDPLDEPGHQLIRSIAKGVSTRMTNENLQPSVLTTPGNSDLRDSLATFIFVSNDPQNAVDPDGRKLLAWCKCFRKIDRWGKKCLENAIKQDDCVELVFTRPEEMIKCMEERDKRTLDCLSKVEKFMAQCMKSAFPGKWKIPGVK